MEQQATLSNLTAQAANPAQTAAGIAGLADRVTFSSTPLFREEGWNQTVRTRECRPSFAASLPQGRRNPKGVGMDFGQPERYLSVKEFGGVFGWSDDTIRRLISRKVIKAVVLPQANPKKRTHRRIRIPASEVARFTRHHLNA